MHVRYTVRHLVHGIIGTLDEPQQGAVALSSRGHILSSKGHRALPIQQGTPSVAVQGTVGHLHPSVDALASAAASIEPDQTAAVYYFVQGRIVVVPFALNCLPSTVCPQLLLFALNYCLPYSTTACPTQLLFAPLNSPVRLFARRSVQGGQEGHGHSIGVHRLARAARPPVLARHSSHRVRGSHGQISHR